MSSEIPRQVPNRRIRPVERQPMREWLTDLLDSNEVASLSWLNKPKGEFSIKWCHGSRHGWSLKDADLFERWAKHTGRYLFGGKTDPKRWKANFRCALNSLKNVEEIRDKSVAKGSNAARIYRMKDVVKKDTKANSGSQRIQKCQRTNLRVLAMKKESSESEEYWTSGSEAMEEEIAQLKVETHTQIRTADIQVKPEVSNLLPNFDKISPGIDNLEFGKKYCLPRHSSAFSVSLGPSQSVSQSTSPLANIKISLPESFKRQLSNNLTSQTFPHPDTNPFVFPTVTIDNKHIVFPESPEASSGSPASIGQDEEMVALDVYEVSEEVVITTPDTSQHAGTYITLDTWTQEEAEASTALANLITAETAQSTPSYGNTYMHGYNPLTPP